MAIWACKSTSKVKQETKKSCQCKFNFISSIYPWFCSLEEDSESLIYQDRSIGQKVAKERLKHKQGKDKVGETTVTNLLQQFKDTIVEIED